MRDRVCYKKRYWHTFFKVVYWRKVCWLKCIKCSLFSPVKDSLPKKSSYEKFPNLNQEINYVDQRLKDDIIKRKIFRRKKINGYIRRKVIKPIQYTNRVFTNYPEGEKGKHWILVRSKQAWQSISYLRSRKAFFYRT